MVNEMLICHFAELTWLFNHEEANKFHTKQIVKYFIKIKLIWNIKIF